MIAIPDIKGVLRRERERRPWLDHLLRAASRFQAQRGDFYAAGITYFTVLALFPLLMVAFSAAGFVLAGNEHLLNELQDKITQHVSGSMGDQLKSLIHQAISSRAGVGIIGLAGGVYAGLGWMANLRAALTEQWDQKHETPNFVMTKVRDFGALIGLVLALAVSVGLSAVGSGAVGRRLLALVHLADAPGAWVVLKVISIVLAIFASWLVFVWVIARLPREPVTLGSAARAALLAAVVFEIFKQIATVYLGAVLKSPAGVTFGPIIGIMVFSFFTFRIILFATAWAATTDENLAKAPVPPPDTAIIQPRIQVRSGPSMASSVAFVAAGVLAALGISGIRRRR